MRLIDADKFQLLPNKLDADLSEYERGYLDAQSNMNALPTIDAVPVVWCKDCFHCVVDGTYYCMVNACGVEQNGFCSYGKRRMSDATNS